MNKILYNDNFIYQAVFPDILNAQKNEYGRKSLLERIQIAAFTGIKCAAITLVVFYPVMKVAFSASVSVTSKLDNIPTSIVPLAAGVIAPVIEEAGYGMFLRKGIEYSQALASKHFRWENRACKWLGSSGARLAATHMIMAAGYYYFGPEQRLIAGIQAATLLVGGSAIAVLRETSNSLLEPTLAHIINNCIVLSLT